MCNNGILDLQPLAFDCQLGRQDLAKLKVAAVLGEMGMCTCWRADI